MLTHQAYLAVGHVPVIEQTKAAGQTLGGYYVSEEVHKGAER